MKPGALLVEIASIGLASTAGALERTAVRLRELNALVLRGAPDPDETSSAVSPQDPLTPEAEELLYRESTRAGETPDEEPPVVIERRVRRP